MASDDPPGKDAGGKNASDRPSRFYGGPRSIGTLLPAVTRPAFRSRAAGAAQLMADWPAIVGPALAAVSAPRALSRTTLTLACAGPVALELQHLAGQLAERINAHYGRTMVEQFRFVQAAATPGTSAAPRTKRVPPAPVEVPDMKEGALRDALAALGGAVAQASKRGSARRGAGRGLTRPRGSEA
jgi:hypothetical protein